MPPEILSVIVLSLFARVYCTESDSQVHPEQIHLSLGDNPEDVVVTWITFSPTEHSHVWYGSPCEGLTQRAEGSSTRFVDGGKSRTIRYVHRVILQSLEPRHVYVYQCGSAQGVSDSFAFKTIPKGANWSPRVIVFGDMGWIGAAIFPFLLKERCENEVDAIIHVGDIAYNMDSCDGRIGDEFLRMIQPVASSIPYMTAVGNHEQAYNFSHYKNKFSMPGPSQGLFYSFDLGPAHFIAISTEVYYFTDYGIEPLMMQYEWLKQDLKTATKNKNRSIRPWIIVFGHRPMYCSSDTEEDCSFETNLLKSCCVNSRRYDLESLLHQNRVDIIFSGHMHYYERTWPIYNNRIYNGSFGQPYRNAGASVHVITGAAGMEDGPETASNIRRDWFPFYSNDHSYTVLTISNKTHLHLEQVSATQNGKIIDSIWLIKDVFCDDA